jgi:hypothetical protein
MPSGIGKGSLNLFPAYEIATLLGIPPRPGFDVLYEPPASEELGVPLTQTLAYLFSLLDPLRLNLLGGSVFIWGYFRNVTRHSRMLEGLRLGFF